MEKTYATLLASSLKSAHETLEATMQGVDDTVAHWQPQGKALPIAPAYAHAVISEDILGSWMTKQKALVEGEWGAKLGLSSPHPAMDADWETNFIEWCKTVKMDLPKFHEYAKAVYKNTEDYVASLSDSDLIDKKVDLSIWSMGEWSVAKFVIDMLLMHAFSLTGEISSVKGLQGLKGYPF
jgi:hypothetical protein